ncbi:MAG: 4'-phosphopantetheinyl transferase superfamily protein, partial [Alistipes sp.]|nr:4'-phosphopantetheinyl transferase superfamily protein [Alistipes sp.]
ALRTLLPNARITYDPHGAPLIGNAPGYHYVGFSHCRGAAAAIASAYPCAVDIEHLGRDFTRASAKFVSEAERKLLGAGHPLFFPALWCAKEAIYKLARIPGLDFIKDLEVTSADLTALDHGGRGRLAARIGETGRVEVTVRVAGEFIFCYLAQQGWPGK